MDSVKSFTFIALINQNKIEYKSLFKQIKNKIL